MSEISQYYGYSFFSNPQCLSLLVWISASVTYVDAGAANARHTPVLPPSSDFSRQEGGGRAGIQVHIVVVVNLNCLRSSMVLGGLMSSLEQSVDYLDSMFDEALSGSSLRETLHDI